MPEFKMRLEATRKKLLDLTRRNKLLNYKRPRGRYLKIIDESPEFIYQYLVFGEKHLYFKSIPEPKKSERYLSLEESIFHIGNHDYRILEEKIKNSKKRFLGKYNFKWKIDSRLNLLFISPYANLDKFSNSLKVFWRNYHANQSKLLKIGEELEHLKEEFSELQLLEDVEVGSVAKEMGFETSPEMPEIDFIDSEIDDKHSDLFLQTLHFPSELENILHKTDLSSRTIVQESGSNMLYLILGILEWTERNSTTVLKSPLIMVPVHLQRGKINKKTDSYGYSISYNGDLISTNESLSQKLKNDFNVNLPSLTENMSYNNYLHEVKKICTLDNGWKIKQEIALDFLQFGKILMYKDLNPYYWAEGVLENNQVLGDLFLANKKTVTTYAPTEYNIDKHEIANNIPLVLDADSSQHSAIVDVLMGKNVVIEGPPGTGKSQIIANLIATLMAENKSILFVSEKLVALEVVYQRLEKIGLGDFCLELHSHKSEKKKVLKNLSERESSSYESVEELVGHKKKLTQKKEILFNYLEQLHKHCGRSEKSYFEIFWLVERYRESKQYLEINIKNADNLTPITVASCVESLEKYKKFHDSYDLKTYFWKGLLLKAFNFTNIDTIIIGLHRLHDGYEALDNAFQTLEIDVEDELNEVRKLLSFKVGYQKLKVEPYFSFEYIDEYRTVHKALKSYMETYKEFSLLADFENIETEEIIQSLKSSLGILNQLSEFETNLKDEVKGYASFILESENNYYKFNEIAKQTAVHFDDFSLYGKSVDSLLHIALVVNKRRGSFFRFLFSDYRGAINELEYILKEPLPDKHAEWVLFLRDLNLHALNRDNQFKLRYNLKIRIDIFLRNIKKMYKSLDSTLKLYDYITQSSIANSLKESFCKNVNSIDVLDEVVNKQEELDARYLELEDYASVDKTFFAMDSLRFKGRLQKLKNIEQHKHSLSLWNDFQRHSINLEQQGLGAILTYVEEGNLPLDKIIDNFYFNYYNSLLIKKFKTNELFNNFNRTSHEYVVEKFRTLDKELLDLNKKYVAHQASIRTMPKSEGKGSVKTFTNLKLIKHEINKKSRHIPIRELINRAGGALQGLKPCFMMSPLSVSQYLAPNAINFDVLLIDEASQLRPEEALGVIARAKQIVIVGDPKQLPPTSFFQVAKEETTEADSIVDESESILDSCIELYNPVRRLKWHYRSQHESLIDFSNKHFYDNDLMVFPSPSSIKSDEFGVKYTYIEDGYYQGGAHYRHNQKEAEVIVSYIEKQILKYPERSLGVGTFNNSQKELIQQLVDEKEKTNKELAAYIERWSERNEEFFIKNLESLQGDERDVIYISTTYGKDIEQKRVMQRFGPINQEGGWRRLNVLITRSKQKMHLFTSLKSDEIRVKESSSRGLKALRSFLKFLEQGSISHQANKSLNENSNFATAIAKILHERGIKTASNIGVSGYFLDLVVLADNGEDALLAIECDGENYFASKSASDRDRLKYEVLKRLGWKTYRIWSVDWYKNRTNEIEKLLEVVEEARVRNRVS